MNIKRIIDANIILRYILKDNDSDFEIAKREILKGTTTDIAILAEVVYVLKGIYKISREEIVETLITLSEEIEYENNDVVIETLSNFKNKNLDFVDCYLLARKKIFQDEIITFDKKLNNELNRE